MSKMPDSNIAIQQHSNFIGFQLPEGLAEMQRPNTYTGVLADADYECVDLIIVFSNNQFPI